MNHVRDQILNKMQILRSNHDNFVITILFSGHPVKRKTYDFCRNQNKTSGRSMMKSTEDVKSK